MYDVAVILAFSFISLIFAFLSVKIKGKHGALQALFLSFCFGSMMLTMNVSKHIAENNTDLNITDTEVLKHFDMGYKLSLYSLVIFLTYFVLMFLLNLFGLMVYGNDT